MRRDIGTLVSIGGGAYFLNALVLIKTIQPYPQFMQVPSKFKAPFIFLLMASTLTFGFIAKAQASSPLSTTQAPASPTFLTVNGISTPVDIEGKPHFGWEVSSIVQSAYQIMVSSTAIKAAACDADIWDSGKIQSSAHT